MSTLTLLLPGWLNSGPGHWQSHWEATFGDTRLEQHDWQRPLRGDWTARLEEVVLNHLATRASAATELLLKSELLAQYQQGLEAAQGSIILVAHSLGCHLVAAWAAASRHTSAIRGALLVAPPDLTREDIPPDLYSWRKPVVGALPFPSVCVVSGNDPFASLAASQHMASTWGARCIEAGALGHINGDSGLGDWPAGRALLNDF